MTTASRARLAARTAVVTGAAQGQGAAETEALAREGATVVATDLLDEAGEKLAAGLRAEGLDVHYRHLDVADPEDWAASPCTDWSTTPGSRCAPGSARWSWPTGTAPTPSTPPARCSASRPSPR